MNAFFVAEGLSKVTDFGNWIKEQREMRGWSQPQLAERAGTTAATISRFETGARPSRKREWALRLATAFEIDPASALLAAGFAVNVGEMRPDKVELNRLYDLAPEADKSHIMGLLRSTVALRAAGMGHLPPRTSGSNQGTQSGRQDREDRKGD